MSLYKLIIPSLATIWGGIGFKRGIDMYDHDLKQHKREHEFLYVKQLYYGLSGSIVYVNPAFIFITIPKELYRLEVDIRKLHKDDFYYNLF